MIGLQAAEEGHIAIVNDLVSHGASVSTRSKHGCTPLFHAAKGGSLEVLKRLLALVRLPTAWGSFCCTAPLHCEDHTVAGARLCIKVLIRHPTSATPNVAGR